MSHPISKLFHRNSTLSIAADGMALQTADGQTHQITPADFHWQEPRQLKAAIEAHRALFEQQTIDVVLSNALVRYLVLLWQDGVLKASDWQAIAQYAFRVQYGAVAQQWHVAVQMGEFGRPMLAAAIDESLVEALNQSAAQCVFKIDSITPLLTLLRSQYPHDKNEWALVAEPERLLLCQFKQGDSILGDWSQVQIDVPNVGEEYAQAAQLIGRGLLTNQSSEQPSGIASYVSPSLNKQWQYDSSNQQKRMLSNTGKSSHAAWLASLPIPNQALNLATNTRPKASLLAGLLLAICLGVFVMLAITYQAMNQERRTLLAQSQSNQAYLNAFGMQTTRKTPNAQLDTQLDFAKQVQQQLNTPWMPMLAALEALNQQHPEIAIVQISPNPARGEIKMKAETNTFKHITAYLESLRKNPSFGDAALTSQHLEQESNQRQSAGPLIYVFEVSVKWEP